MVRTAILTLWLLALTAPAALAYPDKDGGLGTIGEAPDTVVTKAGFILIIGFPLLVLFLSIAYSKLENRRLRRLEAAKARSARADLRGGW